MNGITQQNSFLRSKYARNNSLVRASFYLFIFLVLYSKSKNRREKKLFGHLRFPSSIKKVRNGRITIIHRNITDKCNQNKTAIEFEREGRLEDKGSLTTQRLESMNRGESLAIQMRLNRYKRGGGKGSRPDQKAYGGKCDT